jgi:hypothetical protein
MQHELGELALRDASLRVVDQSLLEHGQLTPVLVVRDPSGLDLARWLRPRRGVTEFARDLVDVEVPEADALVLAHGLDNGRERLALEEGWLLREL